METRERRPRGSAKNTAAIHGRIQHDHKAKLDRVADALGISQARALDLILANVDVDAHGRPSWWDGPLATDREEELPLQHTA